MAEAGADINSPGQAGNTPLIWSASSGHLTTARLLLDLGAEINTQDEDGDTALYWATHNNYLSLVSELLDRYADKSIGYSPLDLARKMNYKDLALVLDNSKISSEDKYQAKVLLLATQNANVNVVVGETLFQIATRLPQMKKQEYDQELSAYAKTGLKPKDTLPLENIVQKAAKKIQCFGQIISFPKTFPS